MTSEIKPATFKQGVPKKAKNGIYGLEQSLIDNDDEPIVAVVVFVVDDVINKEKKGERYPVIAIQSIEPLRDPSAIAAALELAKDAREERGDVELDVPAPVEPNVDFETPLAEKDVAPVAAITKGSKK